MPHESVLAAPRTIPDKNRSRSAFQEKHLAKFEIYVSGYGRTTCAVLSSYLKSQQNTRARLHSNLLLQQWSLTHAILRVLVSLTSAPKFPCAQMTWSGMVLSELLDMHKTHCNMCVRACAGVPSDSEKQDNSEFIMRCVLICASHWDWS